MPEKREMPAPFVTGRVRAIVEWECDGCKTTVSQPTHLLPWLVLGLAVDLRCPSCGKVSDVRVKR